MTEEQSVRVLHHSKISILWAATLIESLEDRVQLPLLVVRVSEWEFGKRVVLGLLVISICGIIGSEEKIRYGNS